MDIGSALVTRGQTPHLLHPGEGTFHHPAVASEPLAIFDASASYSGPNVSGATGSAATSSIVGLVRMQLAGTLPWPATSSCHGMDGIQQIFQEHAIVRIRPRQSYRQRCPEPVGQQVTLGARSASVRRVRPRGSPPFLAFMEALSIQARSQSRRSAPRRCSNST